MQIWNIMLFHIVSGLYLKHMNHAVVYLRANSRHFQDCAQQHSLPWSGSVSDLERSVCAHMEYFWIYNKQSCFNITLKR